MRFLMQLGGSIGVCEFLFHKAGVDERVDVLAARLHECLDERAIISHLKSRDTNQSLSTGAYLPELTQFCGLDTPNNRA